MSYEPDKLQCSCEMPTRVHTLQLHYNTLYDPGCLGSIEFDVR